MGPVRRQSDWLVQMLQDPKRTRVHLVTLPEEMPVAETLETSKAIEENLNIAQGAVFANAVYSSMFTKEEEKTVKELDQDRHFENMLIEAHGVGLDS